MATKLARPAMKRGADVLYDEDYYAWTQAQAAELRRMRERKISAALDVAHLAEEVEDLGRSERDAVRSQVRRILEHLLKLEYSRASEPRDGWKDTITDARRSWKKSSARAFADLEAVLSRVYRCCRRSGGRFDASATARLPGTCHPPARIASTTSVAPSGIR